MATDALGLPGVCTEDVTAYSSNYGAHKEGISNEDVIRYYDEWAKKGTYELDLQPGRYNGPHYAAKFLNKYFEHNNYGPRILDVAAGTGFVGLQLQSLGYSHIDALEPSAGMLEEAACKGVYQRLICDGIGAGETNIDNDTYDVAVVAGGLGEGHIPCIAMKELIRVVKAGGLVILVMREEYLSYVKEYVDRLEPFFNELEDAALWKKRERTVIASYSFGKNGVVFVYQVLVHSCPAFISKITSNGDQHAPTTRNSKTC